jgi:murein DD-endopeptidase MepM/ murein hydrolase activator NlpD
VVIVYAGILYSMSGDNSSKQKEAKEWIWAAVKGMAVLTFGYLILSVTNPQLQSVKEIEIEFIKFEESQPIPSGTTSVSDIPEEEQVFFRNKPLTNTVAISAFGLRKLSDDANCRLHSGIDFSANQGTPVYATATGKIVWAGERGGYGNLIKIQDNKGYVYYFAHLSRINVGTGNSVNVGDNIGNVGSTGHSFGAHLHYEIRKNDVAININPPLGVIYPTGNGENYCASR